MEPLVLAKCWTLDDGTVCLLTKVQDRTWELRIVRGTRSLRVESFGDLRVAVITAHAWRTSYTDDAMIA